MARNKETSEAFPNKIRIIVGVVLYRVEFETGMYVSGIFVLQVWIVYREGVYSV